MENTLSILENKELAIKSIELVEIINQFRTLEDGKSELQHKTLMEKIRKEINVLKSLDLSYEQNFLPVEYIDAKGEKRPCFELTRDGMLQMLNSESVLVRYKTIEYINKLENEFKNNQILIAGQKISQLEATVDRFERLTEEAKQQYKPSHKIKLNYNKIIRMLSDNRDEAEDIKEWTFATLNISKWEDTCVSDHDKIIEAIKTGAKLLAINKIEQPSLF